MAQAAKKYTIGIATASFYIYCKSYTMPSVFNASDVAVLIDRLNQLGPAAQAKWGKMDVAQMLAHCNVTYELMYTNKHPKPGAFKAFLLRSFVKPIVTNDKPYKPNSPTSPAFKIVDAKNFEAEKQRLTDHIYKTQQLGEDHFDGQASHSFGKLNKAEWNNMLYKHLDHHFRQFGV